MSWTEMTAWGMVVFFCATVAFTLTDIRDDVAELTFAEQVK